MIEFAPQPSAHEVAQRREQAAPGCTKPSRTSVFAAGALTEGTKRLIAVSIAHPQCSYCIDGRTGTARSKGASEEEVVESIRVAAGTRTGGARAHSTRGFEVVEEQLFGRIELIGERHGRTFSAVPPCSAGGTASEQEQRSTWQ